MLYLNADVGERPQALEDGSEEALIQLLDWANIACGGHAGNHQSMAAVVELCRKYGVQVGAHPSYPDRANFGREQMACTPEQIAEFVAGQVNRLRCVAREHGCQVTHVKPHGALYNVAAKDPVIAGAIARGVSRVDDKLILVGLAESQALAIWRDAGFAVAPEAFADRRYEVDGTLRPRQFADALITDPHEAAEQALNIAQQGHAATICIHSDTPGALAIATAVRKAIRSESVGDT